jgi:hypothetical protein
MSLNQELMEASCLTAEMDSPYGTEIERTEFENIYAPFPPMDSLLKKMDAGAVAKEQALREMVLQSRKRKLLQPTNQQLTTATTPTPTSGISLEQHAVNFIADAIARPPPAKRVKITPSPSAMAVWRSRLEQHITSYKAMMARIQSTQSRTERNRLMEIIREKERCVSRWHILDLPYFK